MGIGWILLSIFISAGVLWGLLRLFANDEADLTPPRYSIFGACYWFVMWMGTTALQWGAWTLIPMVILTVFALYQFFYVTIVKSIWLGIVFVVLRSLLDVGMAVGMQRLAESVR